MNKKPLYILTVALILAGCTKDPAFPDSGSITVEAGIGTMTKVTTDGVASTFETGDKIAVYAWTGSAAAVPAERVVDGVVNTLGSDGKWTPASQMRWKPGTDAHYFLGVSPVRAVSDFTADAVTLSGDYAKDDLLFAKRLEGLTPGTTPVALTFEHAMARLTVNLKVRNEFGASPAVTVSVTAKSGATVNYLTQAVTATGDASALSLTAAASAPTGYTHSFSGIQVPQEGVKSVTITIDGKDYFYEAGEDIPLASGHHTTLGLIVGKDKLELSGVSVSDWTAGSAVAGGEAKRDFTRVPLTFEAQTAGAQVSFTLASIVTGVVLYSTDGSTWTDYVSGTPIMLANVGDVVMFKGDNAGYYADFNDYSRFSCTEACSVYGNIMSLVSSTDFATATTLSADYAYYGLFYNNSNLRSDASKELVLPATTLAERCYAYMFSDCTGLTTAPALPATSLPNSCYCGMFEGCSNLTEAPALPAMTLQQSCYMYMFQNCISLTTAPKLPATTLSCMCYYGMFKGCSNLTTAPKLPAMTLAERCYMTMFSGCSSLKTAPELPATTLDELCYDAMFEGCSNLTTAPELPATTLAKNCYDRMFVGCASLITAPELPATTLAKSCYSSMFEGCSNLTTAPDLPATTLAPNCYDRMFFNCSSLNSITCLATDISADGTSEWLYGVAATGTFIGSSEAGWTMNSPDGIPSGWTLLDYSVPLTFKAMTAGAQVSFTLASTVSGVQYSKDGLTWTDYSSGDEITLPNVGDRVMFRGDNAGYYVGIFDNSSFSCSAACSVYGNIMSLVSSTDFATATELTADYAFFFLFKDNANLRSDATKALVLPATTLSKYCYRSMFSNCTGLTSAPALPATTLAEYCYQSMFCNCVGLTKAPELPATTLAGYCYDYMFSDCTGLTTAPDLPATKLAEGCYEYMFSNCTGLTTAPVLPATTLALACYSGMFEYCTGLTTAPALPATTLSEHCYAYMFEGCTGLTTAPVLPATTLVDNCYKSMFSYCSSLSSITCAATDISATDCTDYWLNEVADSGTFTTPSTTNWSSGFDGIPAGWNRVNL